VNNLDQAAMTAKYNKKIREELIHDQEEYILKCVRRAAGRYITKSDDEWSVALSAFSEAVDGYELQKGVFISYAYTVIRSRLIDYIRKQKKTFLEIPASPTMLEGEYEEDTEEVGFHLKMAEKQLRFDENRLHDEIDALNILLQEYDISFWDLAFCSPKTKKSRNQCMIILMVMRENAGFQNVIKKTHQLPIAEIVVHTGLHRKIIERYRKYIIAATEIISGDYPGLQEYISLPAKTTKVEEREET